MKNSSTKDETTTSSLPIGNTDVSRRFVVFTYGDEQEGLVQLSNTLDDLKKAQSFCKAWKKKRTFIYEFVSNGG